VQQLECDHLQIRAEVVQIADEVENLSEYAPADCDRVCEELSALLDHLDRHDAAEIELLQESLLLDEGGEG
jgi:hypothetical protein